MIDVNELQVRLDGDAKRPQGIPRPNVKRSFERARRPRDDFWYALHCVHATDNHVVFSFGYQDSFALPYFIRFLSFVQIF
jgi:hypothetical protein